MLVGVNPGILKTRAEKLLFPFDKLNKIQSTNKEKLSTISEM